ncbi:uncharacterized protein C2845_PM15G16920 [Panicum miliaceum]|uniref:Reverse transcriptase zinc-binding domain-containing protein n=1 Tax=Panicum miliaceum TaxID=4540 RepID=A0A3L6Q8T2_PANMI|nr:uncharacterized protein C2845_PM15G16920 [Panicum miliaceum]
MMVVPLPPGVITKIDKRRRSFLWTGEGEAKGANCLIAWDQALDSHCKRDDQSVAEIVTDGLRNQLFPRLTPEAAAELATLEDILAQVTLAGGKDTRSSPFADEEEKLHTKDLYALLKSMGATAGSPISTFWRSCAPPRVQFFAWLLVHERIQCKANLARRRILSGNTCELCETVSPSGKRRCHYGKLCKRAEMRQELGAAAYQVLTEA